MKRPLHTSEEDRDAVLGILHRLTAGKHGSPGIVWRAGTLTTGIDPTRVAVVSSRNRGEARNGGQPILGYEILPNKYFYRDQPPTPAKELLAESWRKEMEPHLEGLTE